MILVEALIWIGLACVLVLVAKIAYWIGKKNNQLKKEKQNV